MNLIAPHNGRREDLVQILTLFSDSIFEIYCGFNSTQLSGGTINVERLDRLDIRQQIALCHKSGVKFNAVLNSTCFSGLQNTAQFRHHLLDVFQFLYAAEVDYITIADPLVLELLAGTFPIDRIVVSSFSNTLNTKRVAYYQELGVARVIVPYHLNRDISALREILLHSGVDYELIVNLGCLLWCPFADFHANFSSHVSCSRSLMDNHKENPYTTICRSLRLREPARILESPWIRPEEVAFYEELGFHYFKIAGRNRPVEWVISVIGAYLHRAFDGNLIDLMSTAGEISSVYHLDNRKLDEFTDLLRNCNGSDQSNATVHSILNNVLEIKDNEALP